MVCLDDLGNRAQTILIIYSQAAERGDLVAIKRPMTHRLFHRSDHRAAPHRHDIFENRFPGGDTMVAFDLAVRLGQRQMFDL